MATPKKIKCVCATNIKHNGKLYKKDDEISLTEEEKAQLVKLKALKVPSEPEPEQATENGKDDNDANE